MKFVNRTEERKFIKKVIDEIIEGQETCIWIEGTRGSGKSYFIKHIKENTNVPIFPFENHNWIYKCNESTIHVEYQFFVDIVSDFQLRYPKEFNKFLVKHFENIYEVSWVEALACILPSIKYTEWASTLMNKQLNKIESAKQDISSRLYKSGLRTFFAKAVVWFFSEIEKKQSVLFCIDDACWLDEESINTLKVLLHTVKYQSKSDLKMSLVILTRPVEQLNPEKENYHFLETTLRDVYENMKYIRIKNFDYKATQEYIELMDKCYIREVTHSIFQITDGNPQELYQALKFNDCDLEELIREKDNVSSSNFISAELIIKLSSENAYVLPIICSIALMQQRMQLNWLTRIARSFCRYVLKEEFNIIKYDECIQLLKGQNIIEANINFIDIMHDSIKETAIEYIRNNGEYFCYLECLTQTMEREFELSDILLKELLYLYSLYDPVRCFNLFISKYKSNTCCMESSAIRCVALNLTKEKGLYSKENIIKYIVPIILDRCIQLSYYDFGYIICSIISFKEEGLPIKTRHRYLISFTKILIERGFLNKEERFNAIDVIERAISIEGLFPNEKIENFLMAMSAYEHLLDYNNIKKYSSFAEEVINSNNISNMNRAMYLRNQGLVASHRMLKEQYTHAIEYAKGIENDYDKRLMLGTCYNNLALHYLYVAEINKALELFRDAKRYLEDIGYDVFRIINNIAVCYMLMGEDEIAYDFFLQAKALNTNCVFEKLCIQSNISILEYKQGKQKTAKELVTQIIDDYQEGNRQTTDNLVYSSAMANLAYFYFLEGDFTNSSKWYKESMFFDYRYDDDLQKKKRKEMLHLSMYHLGLMDKPIHDIDIEDRKSDIFTKMYALIPFAYYVI